MIAPATMLGLAKSGAAEAGSSIGASSGSRAMAARSSASSSSGERAAACVSISPASAAASFASFADAADAHAGRAGKGEAGRLEQAGAGIDAVAEQIIGKVATAPIAGVGEYARQPIADCRDDPLHRCFGAAVGGEFDQQIGALAVRRAEGVQAHEMGAGKAVGVELVQLFGNVVCRRIAERVDRGLGGDEPVRRERGDDSDKGMAHHIISPG